MVLEFNKESIQQPPTNAIQRKPSNSALTRLLSTPSPAPHTPSSNDLNNLQYTLNNRATSQPVTNQRPQNSYTDVTQLNDTNTQYPYTVYVFIQHPDQLYTITVTLYTSLTVSQLLYQILTHCCTHKSTTSKQSNNKLIPPSPLTLHHIYRMYELQAANTDGTVDTDCPSIDSNANIDTLNIQYYRLIAINKRRNSISSSASSSPYRSMLNARSNSDDIMLLTVVRDNITLGYQANTDNTTQQQNSANNEPTPIQRLLHAVEQGNLHYIQQHIGTVDIDTIDTGTGHTILIHAIVHNQQHIVNYCIRQECNVNIQNSDTGMTALHYACQLQYIDIVDILLNCDADCTIKDKQGKVPIDYVDKRNTELYDLLHTVHS